ncbi:histone H2A-Bbd type 1-like [Saccopteryx bilineata]|uniref:histone H2A-Bbd type 1-like n=1 Tax=Saccopteryx bilineata TaxID=59482 RepID=UPI00338F9F6B
MGQSQSQENAADITPRERRDRHQRKKRAPSRTPRAELQISVSHVDRHLRRDRYARRLSSVTPVFLAGILEFVVSYILELMSKEADNHHRGRITSQDLVRVAERNPLLRSLFQLDT